MTEIRAAGANDAAVIADILTEAFSDDPIMNWMFGCQKPIGDMFRVLTKAAYLKDGFGDVAGDEAAALWLPAQMRLRLSRLRQLELAARVFVSGGSGAVRRMKRTGAVLGSSHPREPHYYLFAVGVRAHAQGGGLGGALVRAGLARADADGAAAYLENSKSRNTPLYERLGFAPTGWLPLPQGAPPLLAMLRPAQSASVV